MHVFLVFKSLLNDTNKIFVANFPLKVRFPQWSGICSAQLTENN